MIHNTAIFRRRMLPVPLYLCEGFPLSPPAVSQCRKLGKIVVCGELCDDLVLLQAVGLTLQSATTIGSSLS
jgi:hypothetical protein